MKSNWYSEKDWVEDLESVLLIILDYISMEGNKLWCFLNSKGLFKIQNTVHNFWTKFYTVEGFPWCTHAAKVSTRCTINWISVFFFQPCNKYLFLEYPLLKYTMKAVGSVTLSFSLFIFHLFSFYSYYFAIFLLLHLSLYKLTNKTLCQEDDFNSTVDIYVLINCNVGNL